MFRIDTCRFPAPDNQGIKRVSALLRPIILLLLSGMALAGCTLARQEHIDALASASGFERRIIKGGMFEHVVWLNQPARPGNTLHIYLEGDGSPWIRHTWVASDPTPERPLMLKLMQMDNVQSIYLGRPCYFGLANQPPCEPRYWTGARYSETVVESLYRALNRVIEQTNSRTLVFMGHSGGGTLAMLLAERFPQTRAVVTLAGNLDIDRWTELHGYLPLRASLNPAKRAPLPVGIYQLHLAGARDRVVPPGIIEPVVTKQPGGNLVIVPDYNHTCCWNVIWPDVLRTVENETRTPSARQP